MALVSVAAIKRASLTASSHDPASVKYDKNLKVNWSALQGLFLDECDSCVLFLLDCCFAASAVQYTHGNSVVEAIVAAGVDRVAPLQGTDSFTRFLRETLRECRTKEETGIYSARLCSLISAKLNQTDSNMEKGTSRRVTPHHLVFSNRPSMIYLHPLDREAAIECEERPHLSPVLQQSTTLPVTSEPMAIEPVLEKDSALAKAGARSQRESARPSGSVVDLWAYKFSSASIVSGQNGLAPSRALSPALSNSETSDHGDMAIRWSGWQGLSEQKSKPLPYRSLRPGCMRIVHLHPSSNPSDAIICSFTIHNIESYEYCYDAISHVWRPEGLPQKAVTIQIADGDHIFPIDVLPNQEQALRQIRNDSHKVSLWIDALCINQQNEEERNDQIMRMPMIFGRASEVIVWLGDGDDDTKTAMKFIPQLVDLKDFDRLLKSEETPAQCRVLVKLLENPYFSRRWVFLEVILARRAVVRCGAQCVPWEDLCDAVLLLGSRFEDIQFLCKRHALTQE
jgi:hypothetical protein